MNTQKLNKRLSDVGGLKKTRSLQGLPSASMDPEADQAGRLQGPKVKNQITAKDLEYNKNFKERKKKYYGSEPEILKYSQSVQDKLRDQKRVFHQR